MLIVSSAVPLMTSKSAFVMFKVIAAPAFKEKPCAILSLDVATVMAFEDALFTMVMSLRMVLLGSVNCELNVMAESSIAADASVGVNLMVVTVVARSTSVNEAFVTDVTV